MAPNSILGNLNRSGNNPMPQLGDSAGRSSKVFGQALGQCANSNSPAKPWLPWGNFLERQRLLRYPAGRGRDTVWHGEG
jgi:hypothetical protein